MTLVLVKLGGSVITDKARPAPGVPRPEAIVRLAGEIARCRGSNPALRLVVGHGSGSFGHALARRYGTRGGVRSASDWLGFAQVAAAAARLNRLVADALLAADVPAWSLAPSASAMCREGVLVSMATAPVEQALAHGLVPLVYGDVALDQQLGGTIVSTEQVLAYLARQLGGSSQSVRMVLLTDVDGVFEADPRRDPGARPIPTISAHNWTAVRAVLGGSGAPDVTGGMLSKMESMIELVQELPGLTVHILSGERIGALEAALSGEATAAGGTAIRWTPPTPSPLAGREQGEGWPPVGT